MGYVYYSKLKNNAKAKENFQKYLQLNPNASDKSAIETIIQKLQ